ARGIELRHRVAQRVVQAQADDMARSLALGNREPHVARGVLDALHDAARRIDERAVPVEHHQGILHLNVLRTNAPMSSGSLDSNFRACFSRGCCSASLAACSSRRFTPALAIARLSSKSPYLSSPSTGCPACARWTRIWWVLPV